MRRARPLERAAAGVAEDDVEDALLHAEGLAGDGEERAVVRAVEERGERRL